MKKSLLVLATLLSCLNSFAQDDPKSKAIVDKLVAKSKAYTTFDADFSSRLVNTASKLDVRQSGNVKVKGSRFNLTLTDNTIINDGKAIWTYSKKSNEVTISDPAEMDKEVDPTKIFTIYENGFKSEFVEEKAEPTGTVIQVVKLFPLDPKSKAYHTVILTVDKAKAEPKTVKVLYKNGNEVTYTLNAFTPNVTLSDAVFAFDKSKYPGVEINDVR